MTFTGKVYTIFFILFSISLSSVLCGERNTGKLQKEDKRFETSQYDYFAGLRRSHYGYRAKNMDDNWWAERAIEYSKSMSHLGNIAPVIIEIVSGYSKDGTTTFMFSAPSGYSGSTKNIKFSDKPGIDHEHALSLYDSLGVMAIIQFESGNSDVIDCLEIANLKFGHHKCVIGYGIDAEWYFTKESEKNEGIPISDEDAEKWMKKVLSFNSNYTLFMKHWLESHMPPTYRHENLWYLSDSQIFNSLDEMIVDFSQWSGAFPDETVGYQFGYPADKKWWNEYSNPVIEVSDEIVKKIKNTKYIFWVDFTAKDVEFVK